MQTGLRLNAIEAVIDHWPHGAGQGLPSLDGVRDLMSRVETLDGSPVDRLCATVLEHAVWPAHADAPDSLRRNFPQSAYDSLIATI